MVFWNLHVYTDDIWYIYIYKFELAASTSFWGVNKDDDLGGYDGNLNIIIALILIYNFVNTHYLIY